MVFLGIFISSLTRAWGNEFHELATHRGKADFLLLFLNVVLSSFQLRPLVLAQHLMSEFVATLTITSRIKQMLSLLSLYLSR